MLKRILKYIQITLGGSVLLSLVVGFFCFSFFDVASIDSIRMQFENKVHANTEVPSMHACCTSELTNHIELWENLSFSIPSSFDILFGLLVVAFVVTASPSLFSHTTSRIDTIAIRYKQWKRSYPSERIFDPQRVALSRGILHSKAF
jgi:hypothetical protein